MNPSRSDLNRAAEDLRVIRSVLDQTATSFRALAPAFGRMGVVWLVCGLVSLATNGLDLLAYYFPQTLPWWSAETGAARSTRFPSIRTRFPLPSSTATAPRSSVTIT